MQIDWSVISSIGSILAGGAAATTAVFVMRTRRVDLKAAKEAEKREARRQAETFHAMALAEAEEAEAESVEIGALCDAAFSMSGMAGSSHHQDYRREVDNHRAAAAETGRNADSIVKNLRPESDFASIFDAKLRLEKSTIRLRKINSRLATLRAVWEREIGYLRSTERARHRDS